MDMITLALAKKYTDKSVAEQISGGNLAYVDSKVEQSLSEAKASGQFDGRDGIDGIDGIDGVDGITFEPQMSEDGVLSWTNDGHRDNPITINLVEAVINALSKAEEESV